MLNVGIIGTGNISGAHIAAYLTFPDEVRIVGLADIAPAKAEAKRSEHDLTAARVYDDAGAMLAAEDLDLVSIATPPGTHCELTIRSEEHTSELQSRGHIVCRLMLEKKNNKDTYNEIID